MKRIGTNVYVSRSDGVHAFACGWHLHAFLWTRGHRRIFGFKWPLYVRLARA